MNDEDTSSKKSSPGTDTRRENVALNATNKKTYKVKKFNFESDSFKVAIDSGASYCISHSPQDFEGGIKLTSDSVVDGITAGLNHLCALYPHSIGRKKRRIIHHPLMAHGVGYSRKMWCCIGNTKRVTHDRLSNVPIMRTNCGTKQYRAFIAAKTCMYQDLSNTPVCMNVTVRHSTMTTLNESGHAAQERATTCQETREKFFVPTHTIENDGTVSPHTNKMITTNKTKHKYDKHTTQRYH